MPLLITIHRLYQDLSVSMRVIICVQLVFNYLQRERLLDHLRALLISEHRYQAAKQLVNDQVNLLRDIVSSSFRSSLLVRK